MKSYQISLWPNGSRPKFNRTVKSPSGETVLLKFVRGDKPIELPSSMAKQLSRDIRSHAVSAVRFETRPASHDGTVEDVTVMLVDEEANKQITGEEVKPLVETPGPLGKVRPNVMRWIDRARRRDPEPQMSPKLAKELGFTPRRNRFIRSMNTRWKR